MKAPGDVFTSDLLDAFGTPENPSNPIEAKFWEFHAEHPGIYEMFNKFTRAALARGFQHISADMILHRIRWETSVMTGDRDFKINNNYSAYYGRLWMRNNPEHGTFFRTRRLLNGEESLALKPADSAEAQV